MPTDMRMDGSHETEDSWEVLSRTASDSSTDSRTPVALHFPAMPMERSNSLQLDVKAEPAVQQPRRMSLDERTLISRRQAIGQRFRRKPISTAPQEAEEEEDVVMSTRASGDSDSDSSGSSIDPSAGIQVSDTVPQPPQQFYGVLAGDSWCTVPEPAPAVAPPPITLVFAGVSGSGKTSTCFSFSDEGSETNMSGSPADGGETANRSVATAVFEGQSVTLVDTPSLGQPAAEAAVLASLRDQSLKGGDVVLVLTVSICATFDDGQASALSALLSAAGPDAADHAVLVFTRGDAPDADRSFLPNYLEEADPALQALAQKVGGRITVVANDPRNQLDNRPSVSRVLKLATSAAAHGASAPWVASPVTNDQRSQGRAERDVSRLRKAVVYSLAACGMMGLHVLTSGGNGFGKRRGLSGSQPQPGPVVWHLAEDAAASGDEAEGSDNDTCSCCGYVMNEADYPLDDVDGPLVNDEALA